jgi:ketosteroid isomerase-like protein
VYRCIAKRVVVRQFARIGRGEFQAVPAGVDDHVHHRFAGEHPLRGERHDKQGLERWFGRLHLLCPELDFTVGRVWASGWPWDLAVAAQWTATVTPASGPIYINRGVHLLQIRRGRVVQIDAYEDSQAVAGACRLMAERGLAEADAPPLLS